MKRSTQYKLWWLVASLIVVRCIATAYGCNAADNRMASNENVVTYAYDHRGRMVTKQIMRSGSAPVRIEYLWDGWNIVRETRVSGLASQASSPVSDVTHNVWGLDLDGTLQGAGGVGGLLAVIRDDGVFLPSYDANGNISEYVSASDGAIVAHYDYSPFGEQLITSGPLAVTFTHRFSTKPWCSASGLVEYQMRKYCPDIGRWMSRDPIGEEGGLHLYRFCGNSMCRHDVLGQYVDLVYDVANKTLTATDVDSNETITLVEKVFSGNGDSCCVKDDQWKKDRGPLPIGK